MDVSDKATSSMEAESWRATLRGAVLVIVCALLFRLLYVPSRLLNELRGDSSDGAPSSPVTEGAVTEAAAAVDPDWRQVIAVDGSQPLVVHTRVRRGELSFRFDATLDAGAATVVALARETDLMPTWNPYCRQAGVAKLVSPLDLFAYADFKFSPLPVPPLFVVVHSTLDFRRAPSGRDKQVLHVRVASSPPASATRGDEISPDAFDRSAIPADILKHSEVLMNYAFGTLEAVPSAAGAARTRVVAEISMDLSKLTVLGPLRYLTPPTWFVNFVTKTMIPGLWKACLEALAKIQDQGERGPIGARLAADATGVYRKIRRRVGQQST